MIGYGVCECLLAAITGVPLVLLGMSSEQAEQLHWVCRTHGALWHTQAAGSMRRLTRWSACGQLRALCFLDVLTWSFAGLSLAALRAAATSAGVLSGTLIIVVPSHRFPFGSRCLLSIVRNTAASREGHTATEPGSCRPRAAA